jgi:hypothetical protein
MPYWRSVSRGYVLIAMWYEERDLVESSAGATVIGETPPKGAV